MVRYPHETMFPPLHWEKCWRKRFTLRYESGHWRQNKACIKKNMKSSFCKTSLQRKNINKSDWKWKSQRSVPYCITYTHEVCVWVSPGVYLCKKLVAWMENQNLPFLSIELNCYGHFSLWFIIWTGLYTGSGWNGKRGISHIRVVGNLPYRTLHIMSDSGILSVPHSTGMVILQDI